MNKVSNEQLHKYVLVFFDDIMIYSRTWEEHPLHLDVVLTILADQSFYAKLSKFKFGMTEFLYIGYVIYQ